MQVQSSVKYQVLCDQTAIVGVLKQTDKSSGDLQTSTIEFTKSTYEDTVARLLKKLAS